MSRKTPRTTQIHERNAVLLLTKGTKICLYCERERATSNFHKSNRTDDGLQIYCKTCRGVRRSSHYARNRERVSQQNNAWKRNNREYHNAYCRAYNALHQKEVYARSEAWRQTHPEKVRQKVMARYALKRAVSVGKVDYKRILERDGRWCHICQQEILPHQKLEFDHVMPLARGGSHSEANIKPSHSACNKRKWAHIQGEQL